MNKFFIILFIIFFNQVVFATPKIPIEIVAIKDGDTIRAKLENGNKFDIRLYGIDCYESKKIHRAYKQAYTEKTSIENIIERGLLAKHYLENENKKSKTISFSFMGVDIYKRTLGILYFDNININNSLVEKKFCKSYLYSEKF